MCPYHLNLRFLTVVMRTSYGPLFVTVYARKTWAITGRSDSSIWIGKSKRLECSLLHCYFGEAETGLVSLISRCLGRAAILFVVDEPGMARAMKIYLFYRARLGRALCLEKL